MNAPYTDIIEVVECGERKANLYLEHGYQLLGVYVTTRQQVKRELGKESQAYIVQRRITYVLGRTAGVEHYEAPEWEAEKAEAAAATLRQIGAPA